MTSPAEAYGGSVNSGTVGRKRIARANPSRLLREACDTTSSTTVSIQKLTPIVCASFMYGAHEQVEHGKARVGCGAVAGLLRPRRLS
jgi:hypothetical protein